MFSLKKREEAAGGVNVAAEGRKHLSDLFKACFCALNKQDLPSCEPEKWPDTWPDSLDQVWVLGSELNFNLWNKVFKITNNNSVINAVTDILPVQIYADNVRLFVKGEFDFHCFLRL